MISGGCFCGTVRYELNGSLCNARACHCSRCRKAFSGASSAYAELAEGSKFSWISGAEKISRHESAQGWALAYRRYSRDYINQEKQASTSKVGVWQGSFIAPWDWRRGKRLTAAKEKKRGRCGSNGKIS